MNSGAEKSESRDAIKHIVVATDLLKGSERVVDKAIMIARGCDASIDIVHVDDPLLALFGLNTPDNYSNSDQTHEAALKALCARVLNAKVPCITTALSGRSVHQVLTHLKKTGADLLVTGTGHDGGGIDSLILGNFGFRLAKKINLPILLVPRAHEAHPPS